MTIIDGIHGVALNCFVRKEKVSVSILILIAHGNCWKYC